MLVPLLFLYTRRSHWHYYYYNDFGYFFFTVLLSISLIHFFYVFALQIILSLFRDGVKVGYFFRRKDFCFQFNAILYLFVYFFTTVYSLLDMDTIHTKIDFFA